ncbi:MAG: exo-alpha-sialidase [Clostridia bacterium]|nr:exo-alpha-sialidase [Clostridia bacterium]
MKKRILALLCCIVFLALSVPAAPVALAEEHGGLHSIYELNTEKDPIDSHAGQTKTSSLEVDYRNSYKIENAEFITEGDLWYPRIKRLSSGRYILFFQDGRWGPNVYFTHSDDGTNWEKPTVLFATHLTANNAYRRHYATCDAIELENGDILVAAIFHAVKKDENSASPNRFLMTEKGIVTKYSSDGGYTWSNQQIVYHGRVWEPSFLQLPDGTVQMYLTHSAPKDAIYRQKMGSHVSSGVAMLTSKDNGRTWDPKPLTYPYIATRIAQQKIYVNENGVQILTDQMPVAILLHDNETIVMAVESQKPDQNGHKTSIVRSHDFFATVLEENEDGPEDRDNMVHEGAGPYIAQFPSGEIALSMAVSAKMKVYLGNEKGTEFYFDREYNPLVYGSRGMWGDLFITSDHTLMTTSGDTIVEAGVHSNLHTNGLNVTRMVLNHNIDAKKAKMTVDGSTADWFDNTDALFAGSISQAQCSVRLAHDDDNVYFLIEQLDEDVRKNDKIELLISDEKNTFRITMGPDGVKSIARTKGTGGAVSGETGAVKVYGTKDDNSDIDEGYVIEGSIPKKYYESTDLRLYVKMYNVDAAKTYAWDGFNGPKESTVTTWHIARLSDVAAKTDPSEAPVTTAPVTTEPPVTTTVPVTTEPPVTTTVPVTEPPVTTTVPVTTEPPVTTTVPVTTEPPVTTTVPVTTEPPVTTTVPVTTEPPVTTEAPSTTEVPAVEETTGLETTAPSPETEPPATTDVPPADNTEGPNRAVIAIFCICIGAVVIFAVLAKRVKKK